MTSKYAYTLMLCILICFSFSSSVFAQEPDCSADLDYLSEGQTLIDTGAYQEAIEAFTCAIENSPLEVDGYRGRIEARLLAGGYSDAMIDYAALRVQVIPEVPDAIDQIFEYYEGSLASNPENIPLLTGYSFAQWYNFDFEGALVSLETILTLEPDNLYGLLLHGNNKLFVEDVEAGEADFARVLEIEPESADVYFIMADGYLYALGDLERALEFATMAAEMGLDTPRMDAIFATVYFYLGEEEKALPYYLRHIEQTTLAFVDMDPLEKGQPITIDVTPGQTYRFPVEAAADETLTITAMSEAQAGEFDEVDSLMLLLAPDGTLVTGNDDNIELNAGFEYTVSEAGTYTLLVASFEGAGTGKILLSR